MDEVDLGIAIKVARDIQSRIDDAGISDRDLEANATVEVLWTPYTLSVTVAGICVWEDQNDSIEDLTFAFCWERFTNWRDALGKIK